jgi:NAD(P)H-dependent FMN reductase
MEYFLEGFREISSEEVPVNFLANVNRIDDHVKAFENADTVIMIFPLYCDSMPGLVKEFLERLSFVENARGKKVGFIVQSGFPEAIHSTFIEKFLIKFSARMGFVYLGTAIKGGVEGIQIMPPMMTKKLFERFRKLGEDFAKTGKFSQDIINEFSKPYKFSRSKLFFFRVGTKLGLSNYYWNSNLKKNNAYEKRFAKPYQQIT